MTIVNLTCKEIVFLLLTHKWLHLMLLLTAACPVVPLEHCFQGTYEFTPKRGKDVCELCPDGTFMPLRDHALRECFNCTEVKNQELEILVSSCNRTQDTVITCVDGYYRRLPRNPRESGECIKCTACKGHAALPCRTYEDTHCCPGENYDVTPNEDGVPVCRGRPWLCGRGQYFTKFSYECLPCPKNTFMFLDYHSQTECWECHNSSESHLPVHSVISRPCNGTHPALLGCQDGYYFSASMGYRNSDTGCSRCTTCQNGMYVGRECGQDRDTVCCPEVNMTVLDTDDGPECRSVSQITATQAPTLVCGRMQYLSFRSRNGTAFCESCPCGTYMDESNHAKTSCKNCSRLTEAATVLPEDEGYTKVNLVESWFIEFIVFLVLFAVSFAINICLFLDRIYKLRVTVCWRGCVTKNDTGNNRTDTGVDEVEVEPMNC